MLWLEGAFCYAVNTAKPNTKIETTNRKSYSKFSYKVLLQYSFSKNFCLWYMGGINDSEYF